ncbi:dephospho-CoA kinase/protein folding accessory domain-containing protein [Clavibacter michiganensis]|uniref:Dephospho-CoA kinase/protein folding accessory domain-containing protein n=1 Tax=Clavibacter michiganensis TaxID=28447 RepID=A0A251YNX2_9MICO|nr:GrpB family protein [Clavibacter michiganensis]OUE25853.1 dephospho-CoA kinase/protein folding accessory domain-containing protein [Clavibacter michiganensis]
MTHDRDRRRPDVTAVEIVGGRTPLTVGLQAHDPAWAEAYAAHRERITAALGGAAIVVEHIGSTSVPGLAAKPIVDIVVAVADITAAEDHVERLVAAGYELRVREPGHRLVKTPARDVHVHVLEHGDPAVEAYLLLRDRLRTVPADRDLYERTKRELMTRRWETMDAYADAKTEVIQGILGRAREARAARGD